MSRTTGREEIVKAGCECIAYQINDVIDAMRKDSKIDISQMCVDGGPTRNKYLMQFQSDISQTEVKIPDAEELSVIGAGYLAGESAGYYDPDDKMCIRDRKISSCRDCIFLSETSADHQQ